MRLRHPSGRTVHLSCGVSLVDAETPSAGLERLEAAAADLRSHCGTGVLGVALRLPYPLAAALADDGRARTRLRAELDARRLEVVTLSGVPDAEGGGDENPADWSEISRVRHTLALARILVDLLPAEEVRGAIATCGLGRADTWPEERQKAAARHLSRLSGGLADLAWRVGRAVRCGFQPGPGRVLDSPDQIVTALTRVDKDRLGICLDLATVVRDWPEPAEGIDRLTDAGLSVITARITDPASGWQPVLRHLLAADTARTEYVDVDTPGGAADLPYILRELTALGLAPEHQPCTAP
ncbi:sugar phosphate isomerase/epimerase [Actinoplanes sp. DH11]|uniref:sugar phosphate isomerase/epimerase family protein n=1 Tax=Actinoplanes sp. DH11 TaxID=2857011 RepID=UPI001E2E3BD0|nr:TIM barrel protein [Actinoplanes sp. DH11]